MRLCMSTIFVVRGRFNMGLGSSIKKIRARQKAKEEAAKKAEEARKKATAKKAVSKKAAKKSSSEK